MSNNKEYPFVSLIVLNYNDAEMTKDCIKSLLDTDYPNFEIILVDNGSTDKSYSQLHNIYQKNKQIKVVSTGKNIFWTGGCNYGVSQAKGEKLFFFNNDVEVDKDWLRELVIFAGRNRQFILQPKVINFYQKNIIDNVGGSYIFPGFGFGIGRGETDHGQYDNNLRRDYAHGMLFIDTKYYKKLGGFDNWYRYHYEDIDLCLEAKKNDGDVWYCYKSIIYHKQSITFKNIITNAPLSYNVRKNRIRTIQKNFYGLEKWIRLIALMFIYLIFILQDLFSLKKERMTVTIRSILVCFFSRVDTEVY